MIPCPLQLAYTMIDGYSTTNRRLRLSWFKLHQFDGHTCIYVEGVIAFNHCSHCQCHDAGDGLCFYKVVSHLEVYAALFKHMVYFFYFLVNVLHHSLTFIALGTS